MTLQTVMNSPPCDIADDFDWSCQIDIKQTLPNNEIAVNSYNLKSLCKNEGYDWVDKANNAWFNINICGYSPKQCFPADCAADGVIDDGDNKRTWTGAPLYSMGGHSQCRFCGKILSI